MRKIISTQTVSKWAADFVDGLNDTFIKNTWLREKKLSKEIADMIRHSYLNARRRLILLDYDGTLAAIENRPEDARPTEEILALLHKLSEDPANHVVINSGRDQSTLEKWLGNLSLSLAAEHGAFYKEGGVWRQNLSKIHWAPELLSILRLFVDKTPHARLEMKEAALAWHYRESDAWLGSLRARQLIHALIPVCMRRGLQIHPAIRSWRSNHPNVIKVLKLIAYLREDITILYWRWEMIRRTRICFKRCQKMPSR